MENAAFKIIIIGKENVGKDSLIKSIAKSHIKDRKDIVGAFFQDYKIQKYNNTYTLYLWDLKAEEKFETLYRRYFRGAAAAILIFDPTDLKTFDYCKKQLIQIRKNVRNICPFILIGNKVNQSENQQENIEDKYVQFAKEEGAIGYVKLTNRKIDGFKEALSRVLDTLIDLSVLNLFTNDLNLKIIMLLSTYRELSLAGISNYLNKSKATISRYTRKLRYFGLVKSYTKEDEITPGSIDKKYYAINEKSIYNPDILTFESFNRSSGKEITKLQFELRKKLFFLSLYGEIDKIWQNFIQSFPKGKEGLTALTFLSLNQSKSSEIYTNIINTILQSSMNLHFITENQYVQLQDLRKEFNKKLNQILSKEERKQKSYIYMDMVLPLLQLMNIEKSDHKKRLETINSLSNEFK
ncbi:MAG: GTP-binding protein, partial [Candidatus Lokiarchaeota archaeon]